MDVYLIVIGRKALTRPGFDYGRFITLLGDRNYGVSKIIFADDGESVVVPAGVTVTVPADASLTLGSGVTLTLEETAQLVVENKASIKGSGKIAGSGNAIYGNAPAADAPAADTPAADTPAQDIEIPQTGDEAMPMLSAMMLVLTGAAMIALRRSARSRG